MFLRYLFATYVTVVVAKVYIMGVKVILLIYAS